MVMGSAVIAAGSVLTGGPVDAGGDQGVWSFFEFRMRAETDDATGTEFGADDGVSADHCFCRRTVAGDSGFESRQDFIAGKIRLIVGDEQGAV